MDCSTLLGGVSREDRVKDLHYIQQNCVPFLFTSFRLLFDMETTSVDIEHEIFKNSKSDVGYKNTMLRKVIVLLLLCSLEKSFLTIHSPPFSRFLFD